MRKLGLGVAIVLGLCVAYVLGHCALIEIGNEVIVLRTRGPESQWHETRLWVVDDGGHPWINGGGNAGWFLRLQQDPIVELVREGRTTRRRAVPVPEANERIHRLLREKYGLADRWVRFLTGTEHSVPVRLEPLEP